MLFTSGSNGLSATGLLGTLKNKEEFSSHILFVKQRYRQSFIITEIFYNNKYLSKRETKTELYFGIIDISS
ncbi:MAG: hypothetical protein V2I36_06935 [Desulfopila sp.]|nr:hypothetical protein [Desulfopila sp.]